MKKCSLLPLSKSLFIFYIFYCIPCNNDLLPEQNVLGHFVVCSHLRGDLDRKNLEQKLILSESDAHTH